MKKDTLQLFLTILIFAFVGVRLYMKYLKKGDTNTTNQKKQESGFHSSTKEDDYEPYMKK